ncbi:hypothetical protein F4779DRAFT_556197 [Xylariaceae sp. FL0662B]|nr:hypothetical protein F4779DRAFT_556197 [Xylariaceae sp. FL0662B]
MVRGPAEIRRYPCRNPAILTISDITHMRACVRVQHRASQRSVKPPTYSRHYLPYGDSGQTDVSTYLSYTCSVCVYVCKRTGRLGVHFFLSLWDGVQGNTGGEGYGYGLDWGWKWGWILSSVAFTVHGLDMGGFGFVRIGLVWFRIGLVPKQQYNGRMGRASAYRIGEETDTLEDIHTHTHWHIYVYDAYISRLRTQYIVYSI